MLERMIDCYGGYLYVGLAILTSNEKCHLLQYNLFLGQICTCDIEDKKAITQDVYDLIFLA